MKKANNGELEQLTPSYRERKRQLNTLQALPLEQKVEYANHAIIEILNRHQKPALAWSGGKDSTVLLYLVLQQKPNIDVVWINTGVEYPECVRFVRKLTRDWKVNLHIAKPTMTFWEVVEKYGYPFLEKEIAEVIGSIELPFGKEKGV